jgi:hypothetical protein
LEDQLALQAAAANIAYSSKHQGILRFSQHYVAARNESHSKEHQANTCQLCMQD